MDKTVADLNIAHFKKLLSTEVDPTKRQTIARLLAEEEAKLARALDPKKDSSRQSLSLPLPASPMGGTDHHALHGRHLYPTTGSPAAGKDKRIYVITLDDRKLEVAVVWSCRYFFPN